MYTYSNIECSQPYSHLTGKQDNAYAITTPHCSYIITK